MPRDRPRLLLVLPQFPHDPGSGAARTMSLITAQLGQSSFEVHALGTTASERVGGDTPSFIKALGATPTFEPGPSRAGANSRTIRYSYRGLACRLLDVGIADPEGWRSGFVPTFDALFDQTLADFRPDIVFTFGGCRDDLARLDRLRASRIPVVLGLWNLGYLKAGRSFFDHFAAIITPSAYLRDIYRSRCGVESSPLPTPIDPDEVISASHRPIFFTMVNPSWEKGLPIVIRLADMLGTRRPDLPMLIVESRGTAGEMIGAASHFGIDLRRHGNLMFSTTVARAADFLAVTRAMIVPSLVSEGSGRVVSESLVAGVPPIVSDRGGLPEEAGDGGFVVPVPDTLVPDQRTVVSEAIAGPWFELIERLADDEPYAAACARAQASGRRFLPESVAPQYSAFFRGALSV